MIILVSWVFSQAWVSHQRPRLGAGIGKGRAVVPVRVRDVIVGVEVARTGVRTIVHVTASTHAAHLVGVHEVRRKTNGQ